MGGIQIVNEITVCCLTVRLQLILATWSDIPN